VILRKQNRGNKKLSVPHRYMTIESVRFLYSVVSNIIDATFFHSENDENLLGVFGVPAGRPLGVLGDTPGLNPLGNEANGC